MLDQHLFDRLLRQIQVDGLAALVQKTGKGGGEGRIAASHLLDQLRGVGQVCVESHVPVSPEDGALGRLEEDVVGRVAGRELAIDLRGQVVVDILGFPVAVGEAETVDQGDVDDEAFVTPRAYCVFGYEGPATLAGAVFEEGLEGGAYRGFVGDAELGELAEGAVAGFHGLWGGFEVEGGHFWQPDWKW